jgi:hypothetical protein
MQNFTKNLLGKWSIRKLRRKGYDTLIWNFKGMGYEGMVCREKCLWIMFSLSL